MLEGCTACTLKSPETNSGTEMERLSGAEKHQEMQVSGPEVSNTSTRSTHTSRSSDYRRSRREMSPWGKDGFSRSKKGREPLIGG